MGNQCCGQPTEGSNLEVYNQSHDPQGMKGALDTYDPNSKTTQQTSQPKHKIEQIKDNEVEFKQDYQVGEGASYSGQMKLIIDAKT